MPRQSSFSGTYRRFRCMCKDSNDSVRYGHSIQAVYSSFQVLQENLGNHACAHGGY